MGGRRGKIRGVGRGAEREREREEHPAARPLHSTHRSPLQPALTRRPCSRIELELAIDSQVFCGADNARLNRLPLRLRDWASTRSRRPSPTSFTRLSLSLPPPSRRPHTFQICPSSISIESNLLRFPTICNFLVRKEEGN